MFIYFFFSAISTKYWEELGILQTYSWNIFVPLSTSPNLKELKLHLQDGAGRNEKGFVELKLYSPCIIIELLIKINCKNDLWCEYLGWVWVWMRGLSHFSHATHGLATRAPCASSHTRSRKQSILTHTDWPKTCLDSEVITISTI